MKNKYAVNVALALFKVAIHLLMGICSVNQGSEFNNSLNRELMVLSKIDYRLTTPYHPQVFFSHL